MSPASKSIPAFICLLLFFGCAGVKQTPQTQTGIPPEVSLPLETTPPEEAPPEEETEPTASPETTPEPQETPNYRALASLGLSKQAQLLIEEGQLDEAIRTLEQAVNLHPGSGESYYYLAEAWRLKGNAAQAMEYNTLATIRFKDDPEWMRRIDVQKERIERMR